MIFGVLGLTILICLFVLFWFLSEKHHLTVRSQCDSLNPDYDRLKAAYDELKSDYRQLYLDYQNAQQELSLDRQYKFESGRVHLEFIFGSFDEVQRENKRLKSRIRTLEVSKADCVRLKNEIAIDRMRERRLYQIRSSAKKYLVSDIMSRKVVLEDFEGCYILWNISDNRTYVGQSIHVMQRVREHFGTLGTAGSADVYRDYRSGHVFLVEVISLSSTQFSDLNELERIMISYCDGYGSGYNRTRGNSSCTADKTEERDRPVFVRKIISGSGKKLVV